MSLPNGLAIREATAADLETILDHRRSMFEAMGQGEPPGLAEASRSFFARKLAQGAYRGWFVVDGTGRVVAGGGIVFVDFQPQARNPLGRRAYVVNMWTEAARRRRGLARSLMDAMIEWARRQRLAALYLHASEEGRPLYAQLGFVDTNEMRLELPRIIREARSGETPSPQELPSE